MENISQNIPSTAKVERGADGEWILTVKVSLPMQINTWLNSCQNRENPTFQDRKSAESMEIGKGKITPLSPRMHTPVRKPMQSSPSPKTSSNYELPTRMQRQKRMQNGNKVPPPAQGWVKPGREKETQKLSVGISKARKEGKVTAARAFVTSPASITSSAFIASPASITSPDRPTVLNALDDSAFVKWMKSEIRKAQSGLWATRLQVLYKEKFKKVLPARIIEELKFRPDIAKIEEPIPGRYLLYVPQLQQQQQEQQQPAVPKANQEDQSRVNVCSDFTLPHFLPDVGSSVIVYVSVTEHPSCFYVSSVDAVLENLSVEIRERYKSTRYVPEAIPSISPGQFFCAQFTEDGNFYRACVLEVMNSKHVKVLYVDFGNKEVIPVTSLRVLVSDFRTQPIQAFECCLDGIQPIDQGEKWSDDAITKFDDLTSGKELRMTVLDVDDKVLSVSLVDVSSELNIAEEMKKAGLAIPTQNLGSVSSSLSSSLSFSSGHVLERSPWRTDTVATRSRRLKARYPARTNTEIPNRREETEID